METEPNYKDYNLAELESAYSNIDKKAYPVRTKELMEEIELRLNAEKELIESIPPKPLNEQEYKAPDGNWFKLHWQGLLPLGQSYWINVFAIGAVISIISLILSITIDGSESSPQLVGVFIILFYIVIIGVSIWQLTGLYRSADKHTSRGGSSGWAMAAKLMVLIGIGRFCYDMNQTGIPFILESGKLIIGESKLPPLTIRVMNKGTEVELQGGLEFGSSAQLSEVLANNSAIKIIHLNSMGGRITEAKKLAKLVKQYELITYSKTQCASACPIVFLAGKEKLLGDSAKLGFHSASFGGVSGSEVEELNKSLISQLEEANVPSWFVKKVSEINAKDVWNPSAEELIKAGIIDKVVDSNNYALSGVNDWKNPTSIDVELKKHEIYQILNQYDKEGYNAIRNLMVEAIKEGTPLGILTTNVNQYLYIDRLNYYMQFAADEEVIQYMESQIVQMEYLKTDNPAKCAAYTYPEAFDANIQNNLSSLIPLEISEKETIAFNSLIKSLSPSHEILDKEEQTVLLTGVIKKMNAVDSSFSDVLSNPTQYSEEPNKLCTVAIMLNKEINALPVNKAGPLLRSFYQTDS